jgi:hypothetical protein
MDVFLRCRWFSGFRKCGFYIWNPRWLQIRQVVSLKNEARDSGLNRGSDGDDGLGTLTGYVFFGKHPDQHFLVGTSPRNVR